MKERAGKQAGSRQGGGRRAVVFFDVKNSTDHFGTV